MTHTFVLATHNAHKIEEFRAMLGASTGDTVPGGTVAIADESPFLEVVGYDGPEPVEDGATFAENALIKARAAATHTGLPSFADDSGLCVDVMNGAPGIFSARWAGSQRGDMANMTLLLDQLADVPDQLRAAHYVCVIAVVIPGPSTNTEFVVEGRWHGTLARQPRGAHGFGYDPIFVPEGADISAAEMEPHAKNAVSHRARALAELRESLGSVLN